MDAFATELTNALGGPTATAILAHAGIRTVHNWRRNGLPTSRLDHLHRIAQTLSPPIDVSALAEKHGVSLPDMLSEIGPSFGKGDKVSGEVLA